MFAVFAPSHRISPFGKPSGLEIVQSCSVVLEARHFVALDVQLHARDFALENIRRILALVVRLLHLLLLR